MIIVICILGTLLLLVLTAIGILYYALNKTMQAYIADNPKQVLNYYYDKYKEEEYLCTLLISNQKIASNSICFDFSKYETNNIIGIIVYNEELEEDILSILPNQKIYKMKDGSYEWDMRQFI